MPVNSANQGIPEQQGADPANLPSAQVSWDGVMENRLFQRYTNEADRTARNPAPNENEASALAAEDRVDIFNSANWISLARRANFFYAYRTADSAAINNSTVLVSDATLTCPLPATGTYAYDGTLYYDSSTAADVKIAMAYPAGFAAAKFAAYGADPTTTTNFKVFVTTASASSGSFGGFGVGTIVILKFEGIVTSGGAGNMVVQYAQQTADPTNTTIRAGSFLRVMRVL